MAYHAKKAPSSAKRWTSCTASIGAQAGHGDEGSDAARMGTVCHQMSEEILVKGADPQAYLGRVMAFWIHPESESSGEDWQDTFGENPDMCLVFTHEVAVTQEMIDYVVTGTSFVQQQVELTGASLLAEQRVPIGHFTGEEGATGSSDVILIAPKNIRIADFKYGRNRVHAYDVMKSAVIDNDTGKIIEPEVVRANLQMACYALGSLEKFGLMGDFETVTMTIIQPPINHVSEYTCTVAELLLVRDFLQAKAIECDTNPVFAPSADNCHYCRARMTCKARERAVFELAVEGFDDCDVAVPRQVGQNELGSIYAQIGMLTDFAKDIAKRVYQELLAGRPVKRNDGTTYKLVLGKKGDRKFDDVPAVEALLKSFRVPHDQMYVTKLTTLTAIEKLAKTKRAKKGETPVPALIGPTQWAKVEAHITQSDGKPSIAHESDPREAVDLQTVEFDDVQEGDDDTLF